MLVWLASYYKQELIIVYGKKVCHWQVMFSLKTCDSLNTVETYIVVGESYKN